MATSLTITMAHPERDSGGEAASGGQPMKTVQSLGTLPSAFSPSSLRRLGGENVATAASFDDGLVLLGTENGDLVLVDRDGNELHRLAPPHPQHRFGGCRPLAAVATSGSRFAAAVFTHVVIGELAESELHVVATSAPFSDLVDHLAFVEGGIKATLACRSTHLLGLDGGAARGPSSKKQGPASSALVEKLEGAHAKLVAIQNQHGDAGASDTVNNDAVADACRAAAQPDSHGLPEVYWSLFDESDSHDKARAALDAAAKELLRLVRNAAKSDPWAAEKFFAGAGILAEAPTVMDAEATAGPSQAHPRRANDALHTLPVGAEKLVLWPYPAVARFDGNQADRGAWLVDEHDFDERAYDVGHQLLHARDGESLFVVHDAFVERVDLSTGARETLLRGEVQSAKTSAGGNIVLETPSGVSILGPFDKSMQLVENATLIEEGIMEKLGGSCRILDLDGHALFEIEHHGISGTLDPSTRTVAGQPELDYENLYVFRDGHEGPLFTLKKLHGPYLTNGLLFASMHASKGIVSVDLETGAKRQVSKTAFASDVEPVHDGIAWAFVAKDGAPTPRLVALSKGDSVVGPMLADESEHAPRIMALGDGFLVVALGTFKRSLVVVDMASLAPIGEPVESTMDPLSVSALRDEFAVLYPDGSIARHRVVE